MSEEGAPPARPGRNIQLPGLKHDPEAGQAAMNKLTDRLSIWLLVGNASGLLLALNAALDHQICDWPFLRGLAIEFGFGATAILFGHVFTVFSYSWAGALEKYKAANVSLTGLDAVLHKYVTLFFDVIYTLAMMLCILCYIAGFFTIIHAPLSFLNTADPATLLCPQ
jgi:hypothetical protein